MASTITRDLFEKWKRGDPAAYQEAFAWLFQRLYARAWVAYSYRFGRDQQSAQQAVADAFYDTFDEIDALVKGADLRWEGEQAFVSFAWRRLFWRLLDLERQIKRDRERLISLFTPMENADEDEKKSFQDTLSSGPDPTTDTVLEKQELAFTYELLLTFRSHLTGAPQLLATLNGIISYLRRELVSNAGCAGVEVENRNWEELLESCSDLSAFWPAREKMYAYLEKELQIKRDVLYQRMFDLRKALEKFLGEERFGS